MAFTCGFFNSVAHDRKYDAVQHGMIFDGIITDGIYATYLKAMVVKASENASEVIVQPGRAWFNHTWSYNDSDYPVAAPEPEVVLDRIDTLVLDVNSEDAVRENKFLWVQGTPTSQTPEPPALIRTATHNQYPLCDVYRQAGTTMIYAADITNRVGTSDCPFVTGVLESIDIDDLLAQWDDEFHTWENATKASFEGWMVNQQSVYTAWFDALKIQMAGDVADVEAWVQTIKDIIDEETATHLQLEIDEINSMLPSGSHITVTTSNTELYSRTVTITDEDGNTVTSQFDANGVAVFKSVPYVGDLTIEATDGIRTATAVVSTPYFARYEFTLAFWSATVNIIGDSVFGGDTVTITDSTTALVGTVVLNASGTGVFNATYPDTYKFSVTHGGETMEVSLAVTQETTYNVEIHSGLNYQAWLNAGRVSKSFSSLDDVLADEKTLRQLFLVHDAVDYVASQRVNNDLTKIFNTDLAAKWINLSDYALDTFYAVADIKTVMDTADKYGYGEWVNSNGTWGPKGNVPVMTSDSAPYGEVIGDEYYQSYYKYYAFDGDPTSFWTSKNANSGHYIGYKFTNPIKALKFANTRRYYTADPQTTISAKVQASNDGTNWTDLTDDFSLILNDVNSTGVVDEYDLTKNLGYYLYYRVLFGAGSAVWPCTAGVQFYGRELKVSVPAMTSNTLPYGEANCYKLNSNGGAPYLLFDGDDTTGVDQYYGQTTTDMQYQWAQYHFPSKVVIRGIRLVYGPVRGSYLNGFKVQASNDGNTWTDIEAFTKDSGYFSETGDVYYFDNNTPYSYWRFQGTSITTSGSIVMLKTIQFYGFDYSEKEFEVGTTKKWLYDHGVELEDITAYQQAVKESDCLLFDGTAFPGNIFVGFYVTDVINMTAYNRMRAKIGNRLIANVGRAGYLSTNETATGASNSAYYTINTPDSNLPNNICLDVSALNTNQYVRIGDSNTGGRLFNVSELWLE